MDTLWQETPCDSLRWQRMSDWDNHISTGRRLCRLITLWTQLLSKSTRTVLAHLTFDGAVRHAARCNNHRKQHSLTHHSIIITRLSPLELHSSTTGLHSNRFSLLQSTRVTWRQSELFSTTRSKHVQLISFNLSYHQNLCDTGNIISLCNLPKQKRRHTRTDKTTTVFLGSTYHCGNKSVLIHSVCFTNPVSDTQVKFHKERPSTCNTFCKSTLMPAPWHTTQVLHPSYWYQNLVPVTLLICRVFLYHICLVPETWTD